MRASSLGLLARHRIAGADPREAARLAPRYLRASDARPPAKAGID
jgi:hypothetical protein